MLFGWNAYEDDRTRVLMSHPTKTKQFALSYCNTYRRSGKRKSLGAVPAPSPRPTASPSILPRASSQVGLKQQQQCGTSSLTCLTYRLLAADFIDLFGGAQLMLKKTGLNTQ